MTHDELEQYVNAIAAEVSGRIIALIHVVRVLQSQPGYDHDAFCSMIAGLSAIEADHGLDAMTPRQREVFDQTVSRFRASPVPPLPEPWIQRPPKP